MYRSAADYSPLLWQAVTSLERSGVEERAVVYDHARRLLLKQLWTNVPPLPYHKIREEKLILERALRDVELKVWDQAPARPKPAPRERRPPRGAPPPPTSA